MWPVNQTGRILSSNNITYSDTEDKTINYNGKKTTFVQMRWWDIPWAGSSLGSISNILIPFYTRSAAGIDEAQQVFWYKATIQSIIWRRKGGGSVAGEIIRKISPAQLILSQQEVPFGTDLHRSPLLSRHLIVLDILIFPNTGLLIKTSRTWQKK